MDNKKFDIFGLIALISAGISAVLAVLGTTFVCACSASKSWSIKGIAEDGDLHKLSMTMLLSIFAIILAIVAIVFAILANMKANSLMGKIALLVGVVALLYAAIPMFTICGYNCALNGAMKKL